MIAALSLFFFFFKQKTAYEMRISDWSSDVCSSDLLARRGRRCPGPAFRDGEFRQRRDARRAASYREAGGLLRRGGAGTPARRPPRHDRARHHAGKLAVDRKSVL